MKSLLMLHLKKRQSGKLLTRLVNEKNGNGAKRWTKKSHDDWKSKSREDVKDRARERERHQNRETERAR